MKEQRDSMVGGNATQPVGRDLWQGSQREMRTLNSAHSAIRVIHVQRKVQWGGKEVRRKEQARQPIKVVD
jgi:hypothetical protein